jgi:hypothetical protein
MATASLTAASTTIQSGQSVMLNWTTTNATSATINGSSVPLNGSQGYSPTITTTYTLVATNSAGSATSAVTVTVTAPPPPPVPMPTASLTAASTTIQSGQSVTLNWTTTNATSATINGSSVPLSGSQAYSPTITTTYTLVATNSAGSATSPVTVTVTAPPPPPPPPMPTALINAMPMSIQSGQSSTLQWSTLNATTITLNGSAVGATGSRSVSPTSTTTYTLVASNSSGSVQSAVSVTVTAPPRLTYVNDIKPILDQNCIMCHGGSSPTANRDFTVYSGGQYGGVMAVVTPFDPNSRIIQMTRTGGSMHGFLNPNPDQRAQTIYDWIVTYGAPQQ